MGGFSGSASIGSAEVIVSDYPTPQLLGQNSDPLVAGFTANFPVVSPSPSCVSLHWLRGVDQRPPEANELSDSSDSGGPEKNGSCDGLMAVANFSTGGGGISA